MSLLWTVFSLCSVGLPGSPALADTGNRLEYIDSDSPYYVSRGFPRLTTPQWYGDAGVEAVVILSIDDLGDPEKYERYLRPVLERLKAIDGRAPVSIMTRDAEAGNARLRKWLGEGLSIECHTLGHPCPMLGGKPLEEVKADYDGCIERLAALPDNAPVAFRVPCCDSMNAPSPRFYSEIFNATTPGGRYLRIDSSVCNLITPDDPELPRHLVFDADGRSKFAKYLPSAGFVNTIADYPYPYIIGKLCWEFPCVYPSDWAAQNRHGVNNPQTVEDLKAHLDAVVIKRGVYTLVFHPHGWLRAEQVVELIDHAVERHAKKVKFLTFREAADRVAEHLLVGETVRADDGGDNGVRLIDLDLDGNLDVVIANARVRRTRIWRPETSRWEETGFPVALVDGGSEASPSAAGARWGVVRSEGKASVVLRNRTVSGAWTFQEGAWIEDADLLDGLEIEGRPLLTADEGRDTGMRFRDLDRDGRCECIASTVSGSAVFRFSDAERRWLRLPWTLPASTSIVDAKGRDAGLRFVDVDGDLRDDVIFSNEERYSLHLFTSMEKGWGREVFSGTREGGGQRAGESAETRSIDLPPLVRGGRSGGGWFHSQHLWLQNEDTASLPDRVDRRSFNDLVASVEPEARTPEASLASLRPPPGFVVELVAAEPLVQDPIALDWGPDGKLWVVEMIHYPLGMDGKGKPGGKVVVLEDVDKDGRYDRSTEFLSDLAFPTSVRPWRKGALITTVPQILYAEDTDGDGRADLRKTLFEGFHHGNEQHLINSLEWGLDHWIYCANGDSGGAVRSLSGGPPVNIGGRDLRIRPDEGLLDPQTGQTQYGRCRDDWGNWFGNNNTNPIYHFVLADHYLRRNPHIRFPNSRVYVAPGAARVFPASRTLPRFNDLEMANRYTSCCGLTIYRDDFFGPHFAGNAFISEPVHNMVGRWVIEPEGLTFKARRAAGEEAAEFLTSRDNWFRPAGMRVGPDGALWVADMYRLVNEHPQYFFLGNFEHLDLRAGDELGRIYRIYPVDQKPRPIPALGRQSTQDLVKALDSPSGWQRDRAHQLLVHREDPAAIEPLTQLATECRRAEARLHALCALDGLGALEPRLLAKELRDSHPGVRRHAVRLCESFLRETDVDPSLGSQLVQLTSDPSPHVRMQLAYTLGEWSSSQAGEALGRIALTHLDDPLMTAAILSSATANLKHMLAVVFQSPQASPSQEQLRQQLIGRLLPLAAAAGGRNVLEEVVELATSPRGGTVSAWQHNALTGLVEILERKGHPLVKKPSADLRRRYERTLDAARRTAVDAAARENVRLAAIRLLGRSRTLRFGEGAAARFQQDVEALGELLTAEVSPALQEAALRSLGSTRHEATPALILAGWTDITLRLRGEALDVLLGREPWLGSILDALASGELEASEIDALRRRRLLDHPDMDLRRRAEELLLGGERADLEQVLETYRKALQLRGDGVRGMVTFEKICATCHSIGDRGFNVGPDLAALTDKSSQALLTAIIEPNQSLDPKFRLYSAVLVDGQVLTGLLDAETGNSVTLIGQDGKREVLLRRDLAVLDSSGTSMMPEGLEQDLSLQDMADLIAVVQQTTPRRKRFAGNFPRPVRADESDAIELSAENCWIYGDTVVFESKYKNLGFWQSRNDQALWEVEVVRPGPYRVELHWACPDDVAGNRFVFAVGAERLSGVVQPTGTWDHYETKEIGRIELARGAQRMALYSDGPFSGILLDLRGVTLTPMSHEPPAAGKR